MKLLLCLILGCWITTFSFAQPSCVQVTTNKTTSLVFPFTVLHVDLGDRNLLVQQVPQADNILFIKAACKDFEETNLSVVTSDGSVYSLLVSYAPAPPLWVYKLPTQKGATVASYAKGILDNERTVRGIRASKWGITAFVKGIYVKEDVMYYQLELLNETFIDYDIDLIRFAIRDGAKARRTASQEVELRPLETVGNIKKVVAGQHNEVVFAFPRFTLPDAKLLFIEIMEKAGGRHLSLKVSNKKIIKATPLPDYW
jgi:conjugative transposon TraN protein